MFENIGGKIKVFVIVVTILNIIGCILFGGIMIAYSILGEKMLAVLAAVGLDKAVVDMTGGAKGAFGITAGLVIMTAGSFACWIISFIPYGLGQLIQNTDKLVKSMDYIRSDLSEFKQTQRDNEVNGAGVQYAMYQYPLYTDQYGRPIYPVPGYVYYPDDQAQSENVQNAEPAEETVPERSQEAAETVDNIQPTVPADAENNMEAKGENQKKETDLPFEKESDKSEKNESWSNK